MSVSEILLMTMEEELHRTEQVTNKTTSKRDRVNTILEQALDHISFNENDIVDSETTTNKLNILKLYTSNLRDEEASAFRRVSAKAKLQEVKASQQQGEIVMGIITKITSRDPTQDIKLEGDPTDVDLNLNPDIESSIKDYELKTDADDLR